MLALPYTANRPQPIGTFVSLLLRPLVCSGAAGGVTPEKRNGNPFLCCPAAWSAIWTSSSRFLRNGGDLFLPENDAGLDVEHWTGYTGAVDPSCAAPYAGDESRELGLPHISEATDRPPTPRSYVLGG